MKTIARVTAVIFLVIGLLVILLGLGIMFSHIVESSQTPPGPAMFDLGNVFRALQLYAGGVVALQGLFLSAIGEGIWLLADIATQTANTSEVLARLTRRQS